MNHMPLRKLICKLSNRVCTKNTKEGENAILIDCQIAKSIKLFTKHFPLYIRYYILA